MWIIVSRCHSRAPFHRLFGSRIKTTQNDVWLYILVFTINHHAAVYYVHVHDYNVLYIVYLTTYIATMYCTLYISLHCTDIAEYLQITMTERFAEYVGTVEADQTFCVHFVIIQAASQFCVHIFWLQAAHARKMYMCILTISSWQESDDGSSC